MDHKEHVMEAVLKRPVDGFRRFAGTRRGALVVAVAAAALAAIVLAAYLKDYKSSVRSGTTPTRVLVANGLIQKGTSGDVVATEALFRPTTIAEDEAKAAALPDAAALAGKVAARDIYPGEQLVASDFSAKADPIRGRLQGADRAIGVSLDKAAGLIGTVHPGDEVDVMGIIDQQSGGTSTGVLRTIVQGALVLKVPSSSGKGVGGTQQAEPIVLRVDDEAAAEIAFAADSGHLWFSLRPPAGAKSSASPSVSSLSPGAGR
jgi:Flp pilus assembly protein CpaB